MIARKITEKQLENKLLQIRKIDRKVLLLKKILIIITFLMIVLYLIQ